jgi:hypothetical protein
MAPDLNKPREPRGNLPERSVAGAKIIWWIAALVLVLLFCVLAWVLHKDGGAPVA